MIPRIRERLTEDMIRSLLARWGATDAREIVGGATNVIFETRSGNRKLIVRITSDDRRKRENLRAELQWIEYLRSRGLAVCAAVPSHDGEVLHEVSNEGSTFFASAFEFAPGRRVRRAELNRAHMNELGRILAQLHVSSIEYPPAQRMMWDYNLPGLLKLVPDDQQVLDGLEECAMRIRKLQRDQSCFGLVHNDLHMHNYHVDGERIWLFDFDSSVYNWFASDIACTWYFSLSWTAGTDRKIWHKMSRPIFASLLEGYREVHSIDNAWAAQIPLFFRFRALSLYAFMSFRNRDKPREHERIAMAREYALTDLTHSRT